MFWILIVALLVIIYLKMAPAIDVTEDDVWLLWYTPLFSNQTVRKYIRVCG